LRWRHARFEWESQLEPDLITLLSRATVKKNIEDIQVWMFSVNSAYECLAKYSRGPQSEEYNLLWKAKAFSNVVMTAWRVMRGRMPTRVCLSRRGVLMNSMFVRCVSWRRNPANTSF